MSRFETSWIDQYVPRTPKVILDVGTRNLGDAIRLKKHCPDARVIAFEASRDHYLECVKRGRQNDIEVYHLAVADVCAEVQFRDSVGKFQSSGSILEPLPFIYERFAGMQFSQPYPVAATRLDQFCSEKGIDHIDVIHMDIQGAEFLALKGLGMMRPSLIFLEINALRYYKDAQAVQPLLNEMGYEYILRTGGDELYRFETASKMR